jgi:polyphosphate glucokinase
MSTPKRPAAAPPAAGTDVQPDPEAIARKPAQRDATKGAAPAALRTEAIPLSGLALGIDVGGTGVKAALVDLATAELVTARIREKTPQPSTPEAVLETVATVVARVFAERPPTGDVPIGCGLPGAIKHGTMKTAANVDRGWIDFDATTHLSERLERAVYVINDADAAGMAELAYGEAKEQPGTVILLTVGTGIGSALISEGRLVPNTEFGHILMRNKGAETLVSGAARLRRKLGWKRWARDFNEYLAMLEFFLWPDRIILGGGVSKESQRYWQYLTTNAELVKARYLNTSGIIGAAYAAGLAAHQAGAGSHDRPDDGGVGAPPAAPRQRGARSNRRG